MSTDSTGSELNEEEIIRSMVRTLIQHPAEWLTFNRVSQLVSLPHCDANVVGAITEYRQDIFAITNDRKLKLRMPIVEDIARRGFGSWEVPVRRERGNARVVHHLDSRADRETSSGCYCKSSHQEILDDIKDSSLPDDALLRNCCWSAICRVRALHFNMVDPETWRDICSHRGYIQLRQNPRGF